MDNPACEDNLAVDNPVCEDTQVFECNPDDVDNRVCMDYHGHVQKVLAVQVFANILVALFLDSMMKAGLY